MVPVGLHTADLLGSIPWPATEGKRSWRNGSALGFQPGRAGSNPAGCSDDIAGGKVSTDPHKVGVSGSTPGPATSEISDFGFRIWKRAAGQTERRRYRTPEIGVQFPGGPHDGRMKDEGWKKQFLIHPSSFILDFGLIVKREDIRLACGKSGFDSRWVHWQSRTVVANRVSRLRLSEIPVVKRIITSRS
jgi:hypothetical protein